MGLRVIALCGWFVVAVMCIGACGEGGVRAPSPVAIVRIGRTSITRPALERWSALEAGRDGANQAARVNDALHLLITANWTLGEAAEMGITVGQSEARALLARYTSDLSGGGPLVSAARDKDFDKLLIFPTLSSDGRLWLIKLNQLAFKIEQRRVGEAQARVSGTEISSYYAHHKKRFITFEQRDIEVLANNDLALVRKARREIEAGADFIAVARRMSTDPEAIEGLQLNLQRDQEEPEYIEHIFAAQRGVLVGPIKQSFYYLFRVLRIRPPHLRSLSQSQALIRRLIVASRRRALSAKWLRDETLKWVPRTDCKSEYVVPLCRQHTDGAL